MLEAFVFHQTSLLEQLLPLHEPSEIWERSATVLLILLLGAIAARFMTERERRIALLQDFQRELTLQVEERSAELEAVNCDLEESNAELEAEISERQHAEEELGLALARMTGILDNIPDMAWLKDTAGCYIAVNEAHARRALLRPHEFIGRTDAELFPAGGLPQCYAADPTVLERGTVQTCIEQAVLPDGAALWLQITKTPVHDVRGELIAVAGIARDITARMQLEEELSQALARQRELLNNIPDIAWLKDGACRYLDANEQLCRQMGRAREDILGRDDYELNPPDLAAAYRADDERTMAGGRQVVVEEEIELSDGRREWYETIKSPIFNASGECIGTTGIARNITERRRLLQQLEQARAELEQRVLERTAALAEEIAERTTVEEELRVTVGELHELNAQLEEEIEERERAETALRASEEHFRTIFETSPDTISISRLSDGCLVDVNPAGCAMFGMERTEILGNTSLQINVWADPSDRERFAEAIKQKGMLRNADFIMRRKNGEPLFAMISASLLNLPDGPHIISIVRDVSAWKHMQQELVDSEAKYRALVELAADGILMETLDGTILDSNAAACTILGYSKQELQGLNMRALLEPERASQLPQLIAGELTRKPLEERCIKRDGTAFPVELSANVLNVGGGLRLIVYLHDLTERERTHEEALRREQRFRKIIEHVSDIILLLDTAGSVLYCSPAVRVLGVSPDEMVGVGIFERVHPDDRPAAQAMLRDCLEQPEREQAGEFRTFGRTGEAHLMQIHARAVAAELGIGAVIANVRDITAQRHSEEFRLRLATAIEQVADMILITDTEGRIEYVNSAFETATGYPRAELSGQTPSLLNSGSHEPEYFIELWRTLRSGGVWSGRFINRRKDGTRYEVESMISPLRDSSGKVINYIAVQRDVTELNALEAQLRQSQKMEAVGQMAGGIAHDFNNLLTAVIGNLSLAEMLGAEDPEYGERLREAAAAAARCADLTRRLLVFSRHTPPLFQPVDLNEGVASTLQLARHSLGANHRLEVELDPANPQVSGDATQLHQVLMNLLINARDAMPGGGEIRVATRITLLEPHDADSLPPGRCGRFARLSVTDTGTGMPRELVERIFEPFFSTKAPGEGTGLGLSIVYGIVKQHKGWVAVDSQPGQGSTFLVYLPLTGAGRLAAATASEPPRGRGETLLVVDDDPEVSRINAQILTGHGYQVDTVQDGSGALNLCHERGEAYELVLMDLEMPGLGGEEAWQMISELRPDARVLFCSGTIPSPELMARINHGLVGFLAKPYGADALLSAVRAALDTPPLYNKS